MLFGCENHSFVFALRKACLHSKSFLFIKSRHIYFRLSFSVLKAVKDAIGVDVQLSQNSLINFGKGLLLLGTEGFPRSVYIIKSNVIIGKIHTFKNIVGRSAGTVIVMGIIGCIGTAVIGIAIVIGFVVGHKEGQRMSLDPCPLKAKLCFDDGDIFPAFKTVNLACVRIVSHGRKPEAVGIKSRLFGHRVGVLDIIKLAVLIPYRKGAVGSV